MKQEIKYLTRKLIDDGYDLETAFYKAYVMHDLIKKGIKPTRPLPPYMAKWDRAKLMAYFNKHPTSAFNPNRKQEIEDKTKWKKEKREHIRKVVNERWDGQPMVWIKGQLKSNKWSDKDIEYITRDLRKKREAKKKPDPLLNVQQKYDQILKKEETIKKKRKALTQKLKLGNLSTKERNRLKRPLVKENKDIEKEKFHLFDKLTIAKQKAPTFPIPKKIETYEDTVDLRIGLVQKYKALPEDTNKILMFDWQHRTQKNKFPVKADWKERIVTNTNFVKRAGENDKFFDDSWKLVRNINHEIIQQTIKDKKKHAIYKNNKNDQYFKDERRMVRALLKDEQKLPTFTGTVTIMKEKYNFFATWLKATYHNYFKHGTAPFDTRNATYILAWKDKSIKKKTTPINKQLMEDLIEAWKEFDQSDGESNEYFIDMVNEFSNSKDVNKFNTIKNKKLKRDMLKENSSLRKKPKPVKKVDDIIGDWYEGAIDTEELGNKLKSVPIDPEHAETLINNIKKELLDKNHIDKEDFDKVKDILLKPKPVKKAAPLVNPPAGVPEHQMAPSAMKTKQLVSALANVKDPQRKASIEAELEKRRQKGEQVDDGKEKDGKKEKGGKRKAIAQKAQQLLAGRLLAHTLDQISSATSFDIDLRDDELVVNNKSFNIHQLQGSGVFVTSAKDAKGKILVEVMSRLGGFADHDVIAKGVDFVATNKVKTVRGKTGKAIDFLVKNAAKSVKLKKVLGKIDKKTGSNTKALLDVVGQFNLKQLKGMSTNFFAEDAEGRIRMLMKGVQAVAGQIEVSSEMQKKWGKIEQMRGVAEERAGKIREDIQRKQDAITNALEDVHPDAGRRFELMVDEFKDKSPVDRAKYTKNRLDNAMNVGNQLRMMLNPKETLETISKDPKKIKDLGDGILTMLTGKSAQQGIATRWWDKLSYQQQHDYLYPKGQPPRKTKFTINKKKPSKRRVETVATSTEQKKARRKKMMRWFGKSKVVDNKGNPQKTTPLEVYHGTVHEFDEFNENKQAMGAYGKGFYFTDLKKTAMEFGRDKKREPMKLYLKMETPAYHNYDEIEGLPDTKIYVDRVQNYLFNIPIIKKDRKLKKKIKSLFKDLDFIDLSTLKHNIFRPVANELYDKLTKTPFDKFKIREKHPYIEEDYMTSDMLKSMGHDGIIIHFNKQKGQEKYYVVFNPKNIKSINSKAFDNSANIYKSV